MIDGVKTMCKRSVFEDCEWMQTCLSEDVPKSEKNSKLLIYSKFIPFVKSGLCSNGLLDYSFSLQYELFQTNIANLVSRNSINVIGLVSCMKLFPKL